MVRTALRLIRSRPDLSFAILVIVMYLGAGAVSLAIAGIRPDALMTVAQSAIHGHLDSPLLKGGVDTVELNGRYYFAVGPAQLAVYLPFAPFDALQRIGPHLAGWILGIAAGILMLPLARAYGAKGPTTYWVAAGGAFGTLIWWTAAIGNPYYLAHTESFLALTVFLLEWVGKRRPLVLGTALAVSFLARPTTVLAAIPFGLVLLWQHRDQLRPAAVAVLGYGLPLAAGLAIFFWFNWVRFGSPLESGLSISHLVNPSLEARREMGLFSISQVPENLRLALLALPVRVDGFPYIAPSRYGMTMLLVSPILLTSLWAGIRDRQAQLLWVTAALVAVPVFLYYGGGYVQYGFRYSLDFTPFLVALMAMGSRRWIGLPERLLVLASTASIAIGIVWRAR